MLIGYQQIPICVAQDYKKWELPEGAIARLGKGNINEITFSPDGTKFAVSTSIGVWIYSAENGKELALLKSDEIEVVTSVFTPDGRSLISAAANGGTHLWNVTTNEKLSRLTDGNDIVDKVALSDDSTKLVTCSKDNKCRVWDLKNLNTVPLVLDDTIESVRILDLSTNAEIIAVAEIPTHSDSATPFENYRFQVWDARTGELLSTHTGHTNKINTLAFSNDGKTLTTGGADGTILLWDWEKIKTMR